MSAAKDWAAARGGNAYASAATCDDAPEKRRDGGAVEGKRWQTRSVSLQAEHVNMAKVLAVLDAEMKVFHELGKLDLDLLFTNIDYIESFPDEFHHPRRSALTSTPSPGATRKQSR